MTFGSEHNTPAMEPIELFASRRRMTPKLKQINYEGLRDTAHQHLVAQGLEGTSRWTTTPWSRQKRVTRRAGPTGLGPVDRSGGKEYVKLETG